LQPLIVIGDKTSHGGTVITCSPFSDTHGKGWARVGDMVSCPRCRGVFPIAEGDQSMVDDGKAVAYPGCKTACGATLIASQMFSFTEPSSGAGKGASSSTASDTLLQGFGHVSAGLASAYEEEQAKAGGAQFRGRFQLVDATTGEPVRNHAVRVRSTGGQYLTGSTDENGFTAWVERDAREALAFDLVEGGNA
jgi:uncharacterized Zn-binding protein involved in type VI secretion